ncbi:pyruvate kinase [Sunxiuqinia dokdonensis]|uniref:pyruvate kinase n=1 Tax=Sunxiuqinia dokdonensis TaxID=1409788 RepID=A0A0L8VAP0_9BACT|nr:pyruvate kinase [Sunxiuqinia dokdonensis]KOH45545.1 pyruvate kinase [Sunxiuqinia dokdonensis]
MNTNNIDTDQLIAKLMKIREAILSCEEDYEPVIQSVHPNYRYSVRNFIRYLKLRTFELRKIQEELSSMGLSSIGHSERYVLANMENILYFLHLYQGKHFSGKYDLGEHPVNYFQSNTVLESNTTRLLGKSNQSLNTRIMVTLPSEAATDYELVKNLIGQGIEVARVNCSHDEPDDWKKMIAHVHQACHEVGHECRIFMDLPGPKMRTGLVKLKKKKKKKKPIDYITLHKGDHLHLYQASLEGQDAKYDAAGEMIAPARISIASPIQFEDLNPGESIWFDDGKIGGKIRAITPEYLDVEITRANSNKGSRLRAEKGINLPDSKLNLPSLSPDDLSFLPILIELADIIGYSFVRKAADVVALQQKLAEYGKPDIGLVLKIENRDAFENLPELLIAGMRSSNIGVMIARGDLAVELGAERISEVQEQILWLCEAAFIPNIWATQVLEKLSKEGVATRAEITDASMAARSECVMLNKGANMLETVQILSSILHRMEAHQYKKKGTLRALQVAKGFLDKQQFRDLS